MAAAKVQVMVCVVAEEGLQKAKEPEKISLSSALRTGVFEYTD